MKLFAALLLALVSLPSAQAASCQAALAKMTSETFASCRFRDGDAQLLAPITLNVLKGRGNVLTVDFSAGNFDHLLYVAGESQLSCSHDGKTLQLETAYGSSTIQLGASGHTTIAYRDEAGESSEAICP